MAVALAAPHFPPDNSGDPRYDEEPEGGGGGAQNVLANYDEVSWYRSSFLCLNLLLLG